MGRSRFGQEIHAPEAVIEHRQEEDAGPSESIGEKDAETEELEERILIECGEEEEDEVEPPVTMNPSGGGGGGPPPPVAEVEDHLASSTTNATN